MSLRQQSPLIATEEGSPPFLGLCVAVGGACSTSSGRGVGNAPLFFWPTDLVRFIFALADLELRHHNKNSDFGSYRACVAQANGYAVADVEIGATIPRASALAVTLALFCSGASAGGVEVGASRLSQPEAVKKTSGERERERERERDLLCVW